MIKFVPFASGSTGNCYKVDNDTDSLMIECGLPIKTIKKEWGFNVHGIQGCLVSHEH